MNGIFVASDSASANVRSNYYVEVPPGGTYEFECNCGAFVIAQWLELR